MDPFGISFSFVVLVVLIITIVSIVKSNNHGVLGKFVWTLVAFFLPILGPILWLIFGRGRVRN